MIRIAEFVLLGWVVLSLLIGGVCATAMIWRRDPLPEPTLEGDDIWLEECDWSGFDAGT